MSFGFLIEYGKPLRMRWKYEDKMLMCLSSNETVEEKIEVNVLEYFSADFNNFGIFFWRL